MLLFPVFPCHSEHPFCHSERSEESLCLHSTLADGSLIKPWDTSGDALSMTDFDVKTFCHFCHSERSEESLCWHRMLSDYRLTKPSDASLHSVWQYTNCCHSKVCRLHTLLKEREAHFGEGVEKPICLLE